jgi:hypothetical protein
MSADRRHMTARVVPLTSDEASDPRMGGSIDERVAAVAVLSAEAWRLAGRPLPTYSRQTMPVRIRALRDHTEGE